MIVYFVIFFVLLGCEKDDNENWLDFRNADIIDVEAPTTGAINQEIPIPVSFGITNGCGSFNMFKSFKSNNTTTIDVEVK